MRTGWRGFALIVGAFLALCGVALWSTGGGPALLIVAAVVIVSALVEPIYGRANGKPQGSGWRATDERFVDPETGKLVTVWFDPASGERRYVSDGEAGRG
jgi:hypothetical protein